MPSFWAGDTIYWHYPEDSDRDHLSIVLCDADFDPETVLLVPINSLNAKSDMTVILKPGDHPFITHDSVVTYEWMESIYTDYIFTKGFRRGARLQQDVLQRVIDGVFDSDDTEPRMVNALRNRLGL